jgi:membrane protein implicated in regulation of membrane protease activity
MYIHAALGFSLACVCFLIARLFLRGSVPVGGSALVGNLARVSVPIPPNGVGAIAYFGGGRRATLSARSEEHQALARGAWVVVVDIERRTAIVRPVPSDLLEVM